MGFMRSRLLQTVAAVAAVAVVAPLLKIGVDGRVGARAADGTVYITSEERAASAHFAPEVPAKDREWIEAAVAAARPEAQRLIAEVDGLVEYQVHNGDP